MRNAVRSLMFAGAVLAPALAQAAAISGFQAELSDCFSPPSLTGAEFYATKITAVASDVPNDIVFELPRTAGSVTDVLGHITPDGQWSVNEIWKLSQLGTDVHYVYVTYPPTAPGEAGRLFMDSGDSVNFFFDAGAVMAVGDGLVTGMTAAAQGYTLGTPGSPYTVGGKSWPVGTKTAANVPTGINVVFMPLAEVNDAENGNFPTSGCKVGGAKANPRDPAATDRLGGIIGYNVWRLPASGPAPVPTPAQFLAAHLDTDPATGFQYFIDLRGFNLAVADGTPGAAETVSPVETAAGDLAGMQNPDGLPYNGDEFILFQDASGNRTPGTGTTTARPTGTAPDPTLSYWYAFQPVIVGDVDDFNTETIAGTSRPVAFTSNGLFGGDHRRDANGAGGFDSVDLDLNADNKLEFISPQAEAGLDGLGLTNNGEPLLSKPVFYAGQPVANLPATGQVSLSGTVAGNDVNLQFTTGQERGTVMGYNVYRVTGDQRVRVNEQPILRQGNESNVYALVDSAIRGRGVRSVQYMVEIVYADGTAPAMVGPFTVAITSAPARRSR